VRRFALSSVLFLLCAVGVSAQTISVNSNTGTGAASTVTGTPSSTNQVGLFIDNVGCNLSTNCSGPTLADNTLPGGWTVLSSVLNTQTVELYSNFNSSSSAVTIGESWTGGSYQWVSVLDLFPASAGTSSGFFINNNTTGSANNSVSGITSVTLSPFVFPVTSGDSILIEIVTDSGSFTAGVNDTDSNSYTQIGNPNGEIGTQETRVFVCFQPQVGGTPTITVGLGGIASNISINAFEMGVTGGHLLPPVPPTTPSGKRRAPFIIRLDPRVEPFKPVWRRPIWA
jgi:hypothetical protein